ncbi:MAG: AI-2E family transporter [Zavarzinella sp.]|nr:AI-2E family transporter [Zavarzinella sp.]
MARTAGRPEPQRPLMILAAVVGVFFVVFTLYWARAILLPFALAIFFTSILSPLVLWLQRRGLGRVPSVVLVMFTTVVTCAAVGLVVGREMVQLTRTLPDHEDRIRAKVATIRGWVSSDQGGRLSQFVNNISDMFSGSEPAAPAPGAEGKPQPVVVESSSSWMTTVEGLLSPAAEAVGQAAFTFVLLLYMLLRREDLRNRLIRLIGQGRVTTTTKAVDETSRRISRYLLVQFVLNGSFGVVITLGLLLLRVQYAPLWGFIAFLMRYVPYIGTWIGVIPPTLFTFAVSEGWAKPVLLLALFLGLEALCNNFFEPMLYGKSLGLSEVAQLVAAAFWAFLWGPIGLILSGPLTTCLLVIGKYVPEWRFLTVLLGDEPVLSPRVAFYQRLAARDHDEAAEIAEAELAKRPAEQVFDDVLVPALAAARRELANGRLSEDELRYIADWVQEVAEEVGEVKPSDAAGARDASTTGPPIRALLIPAKDRADEAAVHLLAHLLDPAEWEAATVPAESLTSELLDRIATDGPAAVVILSLPPGGLTHTRYLCKRVRHRFPEIKIAVCRWTPPEDETGGSADAIRAAGADEVTSSLESTRTFLHAWRAVFAAEVVTPRSGSPRKEDAGEAIGTTRA